MGKLNKDNKGFGGVELLIVIVVVVILGLAGWFIDRHYHKSTATSAQSSSYALNSNTGTGIENSSRTLVVPQLGIKLVNIPPSLNKLEYQSKKATCNTCDLGLSASFTTSTLLSMSSGCSANNGPIGGISEWSGKYLPGNPQSGVFIKQFSNFWISFSGEQSFCEQSSNSTTTPIDNEQTALGSDLQNYLLNPANIQND